MAAAKEEVVQSQFDGKDFYSVLGVAKTASLTEIKRAYRVLALKHHPDRNGGDKQASRDFQVLCRIMEILSDTDKRAHYDQVGDDGETSDFSGDQWRAIFRKVTTEDIEAYEKTYRDSKEEKEDVLHYYEEFKGDWVRMMEWIPLSGVADLPRYTKWIDSAIVAKTVKVYKAYRISKRKAEHEQEKYRHEAKEAAEMKAELMKKAGAKEGSTTNLYALIQNKHKTQFQSLVDTLQTKYGDQDNEPTDEEFARARERVVTRKGEATAAVAAAAAPSGKKKTRR